MKKLQILFLLIFSSQVFAQNEIYDYGTFFLTIENSTLKAFRPDSTIFYQKKFFDPQDFSVDLDSDNVDEFIITDCSLSGGKKNYALYVYCTLDTFYLVDSVNSGLMEPYQTISKELKTTLLVTGSPDFDSLNSSDSLIFLPLNFWKYEEGGLFLANASVYDLFISENDDIIDFIEDYYLRSGKSCASTSKIKAAVASGYINYYNAGEKSLASLFLKKYYLCGDAEDFKNNILKLLK